MLRLARTSAPGIFAASRATRASPSPSMLGLTAMGLNFNVSGRRYKSISTEIAAVEGSVAEKISEVAEKVADTVATAAPVASDTVGYFQSVGLAQSWVWPAGFFQHVFEYAHVYTGLPWWATILTVTVGLRALMMPLYISSSDHTAKMARIKPELARIMERTKQASDQTEIQKAMIERKKLMTTHNIKILAMVKPIFAVPVFLGVFGALSGMAKVPVAGMTTEGLSWFANLAAADPYCGLQVITACLYAITFKLFGGETGAGNMSPVMKKVFTWMPFIAIPLTMSLPAGVCFYFAINAVWSVIQSNLLKQPTVRKALGISQMLTPEEQKQIDKEVEKTQSSTVMGALREKYEDAKIKAEKKVAEQEKKAQAEFDLKAAEAKKYVKFRS